MFLPALYAATIMLSYGLLSVSFEPLDAFGRPTRRAGSYRSSSARSACNGSAVSLSTDASPRLSMVAGTRTSSPRHSRTGRGVRRRGRRRHGPRVRPPAAPVPEASHPGVPAAEYGGNENWDEYKQALHSRRFLPSCLQNLPYAGPTLDGCTACVFLIRGNRIFVGNIGDSRCVLSMNDQAIALSTDHKPNLPAERHRIENAGRAITVSVARGGIPRIDEGIAISRSLGDLQYKNRVDLPAEQQAMTALPEVRTEDVTHDAQFLIIACDGIWDCMTSQQAVDFVSVYLTANVGLAFICEALLQHCLGEPRGRDSMTVMRVRFKTRLLPLPLPPPPLIPHVGSHGDLEQATVPPWPPPVFPGKD